jgi:hypothetical protein
MHELTSPQHLGVEPPFSLLCLGASFGVRATGFPHYADMISESSVYDNRGHWDLAADAVNEEE